MHFENRGQVALEFAVVAAMVLAFFIAAQSYAAGERNGAEQELTVALAAKLARQWATTISLATYSDGYYSELDAPAALDSRGTPYAIGVRNTSVSVVWDSGEGAQSALAPIQAVAVMNSSGATAFNLRTGASYWINGSGGTVWIVQK